MATTTKTPAPKATKSAKAAKSAKATKAATATKAAAPAASRARFGETECHAPGCDGERYLKGSLLCRDHEAAWRRGEFRLSQRGYDRLNATKAAAAAAAKAAPKAAKAAKAAPAPAAADDLEEQLAASVSRFATPALAAKARAKRAAKGGR